MGGGEGAGHNHEKNDTVVEDMTKTGYSQLGPTWRKIRLPVDLEPHFMLIVI